MSLVVFAALVVFTAFIQLFAVPLTAGLLHTIRKNRHLAMELEILLMMVLVLHLINESLAVTSLAIGAFLIGMAMIYLLSRMTLKKQGGITMMQKVGFMLLFAVSVHEMVEGMGLGSSYALGESIGITSALLIAGHNIPEASVVALQYLMNGGFAKALKAVALTQIFYALGAAVAFGLSFSFGPLESALIVALSAGSIMYISLEELWIMRKM